MKKFGTMLLLSVCALFSAMAETFTGGYTYAGVLTMNSSKLGNRVPIGLVTVKVTKATAKKTCKVMMQIQKANQTKYSISGTLNLNADSTELVGKISAKGKGSWDSELIDTAHFEMVDPNTGYIIQGRRNYLEGVDAKKWSSKLSSFVGVWNGAIYLDKYDMSLINCVVSSKGVAKVKTYGWHLSRSSYSSACTTKLVSEGSESQCEIPVNFMKLTDKKNVSAGFNLILKRDASGTLSMELDTNYSPCAITSFDSFRAGAAESYSPINDFDGGKGANLPVRDYIVNGNVYASPENPAVGDEKMFGMPLLATLGYPSGGTSVKVTRVGWVTPKAEKITSTTTLPLTAANPSGIKFTNNKKTYTFKGSYNTYVVGLNKRVKKFPAKINGVIWRWDNFGETAYTAAGYAFTKGPNGKVEYNYPTFNW